MPDPSTRELAGWGRSPFSAAAVVEVAEPEQVGPAVTGAGARGVLARGLGRAYGDMASNAGGTILDLTRLVDPIRVDPEGGLVTCPGGTSLEAILAAIIPYGWFLPVVPGTRHVTLGGALAADVHGKNHCQVGSLAEHTSRMVLVTADGQSRLVSRQHDPDLFWATVGGLGLTGVIIEATVGLEPIETPWVLTDTARAADLDELLDHLDDAAAANHFAVAWIDLLSTGSALGRGSVTSGRFATAAEVPAEKRALVYRPSHWGRIPRWTPGGLVRKQTIRAFNEMRFRRLPAQPHRTLESISSFFHPLDAIEGWNRLYGNRGFVQWQMVVPTDATDVLHRCVEDLARAGVPSFLAVLKRFRRGNAAPLSFPLAGWTLALDLPAGLPGLGAQLDALDEQVAAVGGRIYLAKDARLRPELLPAMYPRLDEWRAVRDRADPERRFQSDLARRLHLLA